MTRFTDLLAAEWAFNECHAVIAGRAICPLCADAHVICRFEVGSLYCAVPACKNPHHRSAPRTTKE